MDLDRFRNGDPAYFSELVRACQPLVNRVVRSFARDAEHARDLSQQVWCTVLQDRASFLGRGPFEAWLFRLARRVCIRNHRNLEAGSEAHARYLAAERDLPPRDAPADLTDKLEREESHARLLALLGGLSRRERDAITLLVLEEKKVRDAAEIMAVKESTVRSLARHAIARLRELVGGTGE